jgi:predicted AAA+ superfamily ATPase
MIERTAYIEKLNGYRDKRLIKVLTGVRRCGKSTLLELFRAGLLESGVPDKRIVALDFDDLDNEPLLDYQVLHDEVKKRTRGDGKTYVVLDEIQKVAGFQKVVASLFTKKNVDLYLSGSNAQLLSGELATLLSGRYVELHVLPLSFGEFAAASGKGKDRQRLFFEYLRFGGFPYARYLDDDPVKIREYINSLYDTILLRDVASRKELASIPALDSIARFLLSNIGSLTSVRKIADTMTSLGRKVSAPTVESYLTGLTEAFLFYRAKRYDAKGKKLLQMNDKFYTVDLGFRNNILGASRGETNHALENIVYLELLRRGYDVCVGKVGEYEIDFVALKGDIPAYFQVAETLRGERVLERELRSLRLTGDDYAKTVITLDMDIGVDHGGIRQVNIADWLMD